MNSGKVQENHPPGCLTRKRQQEKPRLQTKNMPADTPGTDTVQRPASIPDVPAFAELYRDHSRRILTFIYHLVLNEETARDLTQEVFIKVYENLGRFRGDSQIYTWVHRIARNHTLNFLKREKRRRLLGFLDRNFLDVLRDDEDEVEIPAVLSSSPDAMLEQNERDRIVRDALESLPPQYRIPFLFHRFEEMSYQEIATALDVSLSAVETRIHRAKKMLIGKLEPWMKDL